MLRWFQCDAGVGTDVFYDMIYRMAPGRHITMVMGSACAEVTKTLAEIVPYWNLILVSGVSKTRADTHASIYTHRHTYRQTDTPAAAAAAA